MNSLTLNSPTVTIPRAVFAIKCYSNFITRDPAEPRYMDKFAKGK